MMASVSFLWAIGSTEHPTPTGHNGSACPRRRTRPLPHDRETAAFPNIWASGADGEVFTLRSGGAWTRLESCVGSRHIAIGHLGGFTYGNGRLVSIGDDGSTCAVEVNTGNDLGAGSIGATFESPPVFDGEAFMIANGAAVFRSVDGLSWEQRPLPDGIRFDLIAHGPAGSYVGVSADGDRYYFSEDGETWNVGDGQEGNGLVRIVAGLGTSSARCPAR